MVARSRAISLKSTIGLLVTPLRRKYNWLLHKLGEMMTFVLTVKHHNRHHTATEKEGDQKTHNREGISRKKSVVGRIQVHLEEDSTRQSWMKMSECMYKCGYHV